MAICHFKNVILISEVVLNLMKDFRNAILVLFTILFTLITYAYYPPKFTCAIIADGDCLLGKNMFITNPDIHRVYRVTVRTFRQEGLKKSTSDKVYTVVAGGRIFLGCTKASLPTYPHFVDKRFEIIRETKI